ncbi:UNVERIFIED_CONTAM: hypothetical protein HDU68_009395 [Siphonaria sp. JEL0065]|nr:hypothetical protein HDU68_009395 [Siphonaria sp. JEL0065]
MPFVPANLTFGIIGPYAFFKNLVYDSALVNTSSLDLNLLAHKYSDLSNLNSPGWWFWNQLGAMIAIEDINNDKSILPHTQIDLKLFNEHLVKGSSPGYAVQVVQTINEQHEDVVALHGGFDTSTSLYSAAIASVYEIPFCGATQYSSKFMDKHNYPYFFETYPYSGGTTALISLLQHWNVTRLAYISSDGIDSDAAAIKQIQKAGIKIVAHILISGYVEDVDSPQIAASLKQTDARYMFMSTAAITAAHVFFSLAKMNSSVGPDFVWITNTGLVVSPDVNATQAYGSDYYKKSQGMILVTGSVPDDPFFAEETERLARIIYDKFGVQVATGDLLYMTNFFSAYDCVRLLGHGIANVLKRLNYSLESLDHLRNALNYTAFINTGYHGVMGITNETLKLTEFGDIQLQFGHYYLNMDPSLSNYMPFAYTNANGSITLDPLSPVIFIDGLNTEYV